ncbi:subunit mu of clathrin/coatomer adaptor AP-3 complex [Chloropicon primus]|uniref:Subunit mu of clathrin/coatomer adaptor AP-3 complex n=1 Tax=Chloropicon primus TaxID=1764295 RepID=A0A5B8N128_9CHLO|nr:subunit mu of clathrin/coatomer adaptor AP-3 complex [Chloropicon primus]UPR05176.1 subunit mu of clathrin/coatomer adaptor AP-3 complex [Chloropicon primus]|mmetsp:Transcript_14038/g.39711  ORF Transcript_14038/g.39711 Transcript_14038/m.39711 type:complete len:438 (+) Transcript_14038:84-1397(+)|eukprot:QDZ25976.1 subunit mu of clathrin/coatomer adaptor AP-3 complex [Chloropicon primus]
MESVFILSGETGEALVEHQCAGSRHTSAVAMNHQCVEDLWQEILKSEKVSLHDTKNHPGQQQVPNVIAMPQCYLFHIRSDPIIFGCATQREVPPLKVLEFLSHFLDVCVEYFGAELTEDEIKDNACTIYQLLDEMLDGGVPYLTETNTLKEIIAPPRLLTRMANALRIGSQVSDSLPDSASSNIPWRRSSARYANNEIYVDMIEELDVTIDSNGMLSNIGIYGQVMANSKLSGMPDLQITFKNPQLLDDCRFHPSVRYLKYASERIVSFVPPDGRFKLMSYKISKQAAMSIQKTIIPFYVKPQITYSKESGRISIMVGLKTEQSKPPEQVSVKIPLPSTTTNCNISSTVGTVSVDMKKGSAIWSIGKIRRDRPACLNANIACTNAASESPTFEVSFQLQGSALSGLEVDSMEVTNVKYKPYKGVRYITRSGFFQIRS